MKSCFLFSFLLFVFLSSACAQYRMNKEKYDFHHYSYQKTDQYRPLISGFASFVIPGLGQTFAGEPLRGLAFFGGFTACTLVASVGLLMSVQIIGSGISGETPPRGGPALFVAGAIGMYTVDIWSVIDAVRVAKVNNLAIRDKKLTVGIDPCVINTAFKQNYPGIRLQVNF
jgi:hypothetical protein